MRPLLQPAIALATALSLPSLAAAQVEPVPPLEPSPIPPGLIEQDELDLQGRSNLVLGAGARAFGMGGAFLARADDATAASWNPAGLSYLRRPEVTGVGVSSDFDTDVTPAGGDGTTSRFQGTVLDFAAITYPLSIRELTGAAQVSFQRAIPFRGTRSIDRPEAAISIDANGGFDVLALATGWKVSRRWRVGFTLNRWFNGYKQLLLRTPPVGRVRELDAEFDLSGWNINLGLIWSPVESLNLGLVGKTPFTADVRLRKGRNDFTTDLQGNVIEVTTNTYESSDVELDFPGAFGAGASWRPRSQLTISADYTRTFWSDARIHNFFLLPFTPAPGPPQPLTIPTLPYPSLTESQEDSQQVRLGVEYVWILSRLKVPLRAGYFTDRQIFRAEDGSRPWFDGVTVGTGVIVGPILLDVAYLYETGSYVDSTGARNELRTHRLLASFIYRHRGLP